MRLPYSSLEKYGELLHREQISTTAERRKKAAFNKVDSGHERDCK
jgi:hypothetical protein